MKQDNWVQTVLGPVPTMHLGVTHSHEHLVAHATPELAATDADLLLDDPRRVVPDLQALRAAGGGAVVEMTTADYGQDATALRRLAEWTGIHIIAVTGCNKGAYSGRFAGGRSVAELARWMAGEVTAGIGATGVKAGLIKFATSLNQVLPVEKTVLQAAARAHRQTGAPLISHLEAGTMGEVQLDLLAEAGVPADRAILCHLDRNPDVNVHLALARRGAFLSYDQIPKAKYGTEAVSVGLIIALARAGLHRQILLGGDLSRRQYFTGWGGAPGLAYLTTTYAGKLRQALAEAGLPAESIIRDLLIHNPARALARRPV